MLFTNIEVMNIHQLYKTGSGVLALAPLCGISLMGCDQAVSYSIIYGLWTSLVLMNWSLSPPSPNCSCPNEIHSPIMIFITILWSTDDIHSLNFKGLKQGPLSYFLRSFWLFITLVWVKTCVEVLYTCSQFVGKLLHSQALFWMSPAN